MDSLTLKKVITENLRIQKAGAPTIQYIDTTNALGDIGAKQNHIIFARRGCGKTLLLETSAKKSPADTIVVYLNCEDYKNHSFPNVIIEILDGALYEIEKKISKHWSLFGKKKKAKNIILSIRKELSKLKERPDEQQEQIRETSQHEEGATAQAGINAEDSLNFSASISDNTKAGIERTYKIYDKKIEKLNLILPDLKAKLKDFFELSSDIKNIFIQVDDFYHLQRELQPFVVDYIHRFCKNLPIYFKIATLEHASNLYTESNGQPIGVQHRHDYQPIRIDFTFEDFKKTEDQVKKIFYKYGELAEGGKDEIDALFKGDGFRRLVLAGGGVPRDCLSLFLEALDSATNNGDGKISKDIIRNLSLSNHERIMRDLKEESQKDELDYLMKGIYTIREFCLSEKNNVFVISEKLLQDNEKIQKLIYRLLDYKIIHTVKTAFTHKSQTGVTFRAFMINIGHYANLRKLFGKMNEIDLSTSDAKEKIRSAPILTEEKLGELWQTVPKDPEEKILADEQPIAELIH
ncbi:MAG: hypothetical protein KBA91_00125 [Candidatus Moranbacteria bacterium]|nr:hypothetical protein [Candidatus Moranbacteria bacterium]